MITKKERKRNKNNRNLNVAPNNWYIENGEWILGKNTKLGLEFRHIEINPEFEYIVVPHVKVLMKDTELNRYYVYYPNRPGGRQRVLAKGETIATRNITEEEFYKAWIDDCRSNKHYKSYFRADFRTIWKLSKKYIHPDLNKTYYDVFMEERKNNWWKLKEKKDKIEEIKKQEKEKFKINREDTISSGFISEDILSKEYEDELERNLLDNVIENNDRRFYYNKYRIRLKKWIYHGKLKEECNNCKFSTRRISDNRIPLMVSFKNGNSKIWSLPNIKLICYNCYFLLKGNLFSLIPEEPSYKITKEEKIEKNKNSDLLLNEIDEYGIQHLRNMGVLEKDKLNKFNKRKKELGMGESNLNMDIIKRKKNKLKKVLHTVEDIINDGKDINIDVNNIDIKSLLTGKNKRIAKIDS